MPAGVLSGSTPLVVPSAYFEFISSLYRQTVYNRKQNYSKERGGRVERRCWVTFQCRGVLLVWMIVGQGPIALAVGAGRGVFGHFFSHLAFLFSFSLSLGDGPI